MLDPRETVESANAPAWPIVDPLGPGDLGLSAVMIVGLLRHQVRGGSGPKHKGTIGQSFTGELLHPLPKCHSML